MTWRSKPVTQARLALAIDQIVQHMRAQKPGLATMTGLTAYCEGDGIHTSPSSSARCRLE